MLSAERSRKQNSSVPLAGKILLAVDAYLPWSGGSRVYYHNLYSRLAKRHDYEIDVLTSHAEGDEQFDRQLVGSGLSVIREGERLPDWKYQRALAFMNKYFQISEQLKESPPETLHCGDLFPQALAGYWLNRSRNIPYLVFVHGDEIAQTQGRRLQPHVRNVIYRNANAVIAANTYAYNQLHKILCNEHRLHLLTPGVDQNEFYPGPSSQELLDQWDLAPGPVLLTVARLVPRKGHEIVLRSLPLLVKEFPMLRYLIVGNGPERAHLMELVKQLGLEENVHFVGDISHHNLGDYYRAADIFVMMNRTEPGGDIESFGMVFIEAGASAKPVIGGRSGGTSESVLHGETGFLCDPNDREEITRTLLLLLHSPELRQRMGASGLARARNEFDWESRAAHLHEITQSMKDLKFRHGR